VTRYRPFRKKRSYALAAVIILLALILSYFSFGRNLFNFRPVFISALYPFQYATNAVWKGAIGFPAVIAKLRDLARENSVLKEKLNITLSQLSQLEELKIENDRLRAALDFQKSSRYGRKLVAAQVVGKSGYPWISVLGIDRGSGAGVRVGMPVVVKEGLVGKVIEVAPFSSKVLLISDPTSSVAAASQRSRVSGVIEGYSPGSLNLKYIGVEGDVQAGDRIVTSAVSGVFPSGIPIGTVTRAAKKDTDLFYEIMVRPAVDLSKLEEVFLEF
jgi:rod shape-determining protein MreC